MNNNNSLHGKVAVVTGGTQGLGEATARLFAERGAAGLVICGRNIARGRKVARELGRVCPTCFVQADLARVESCRHVIARAVRLFNQVDILVNAAGTTERGSILDTTPEVFDRIMAVNVRAPFLLIQSAAKIMRRKGTPGTVVNVLSMSAHGGQPFLTPYSVSKGALATLTKNVAYALMRDRIRLNGLNIGWMDTPGEHAIQKDYHGADAEWLERAEKEQPFGRLLKPLEVAKAIAFLCSDESGMMTGSIIDFDQAVVGCWDSAPHPGRL